MYPQEYTTSASDYLEFINKWANSNVNKLIHQLNQETRMAEEDFQQDVCDILWVDYIE